MEVTRKVPEHLSHKPIIAVNDYDKIDAIYANDTNVWALSLGQAQYDVDELSVKIWRHTGNRWSRQSEELPMHRAIDLSILIIASVLTDSEAKYPLTSLREEIVDESRVNDIKEYFRLNEKMLQPRIEELRKILNTFFERKEGKSR